MKTLLGLCFLPGMANAALAAGPENPPYSSEEVRFTSGRFALAGTLLTPPSPAPHPLIILKDYRARS
jgi:hypothetical protein